MKKRFLSLLLGLVMVLPLLPGAALAADDRVATDGAITFNMDTADFGAVEYGYTEKDCTTLTVTLTNTSDRSLWYIYFGLYMGNSKFRPTVNGRDWDDVKRYVDYPSAVYALELKPGSSASVDLTMDTGITFGVYEGDLKFYFSNTGEPTGESHGTPVFGDGAYYVLPYRLEVTYDGYMGGGDVLKLSRESVDFGAVEIGDEVTETLSVTNTAQVELTLRANLEGKGLHLGNKSWNMGKLLTLEEQEWTLAPGETAQIKIHKNKSSADFRDQGRFETELKLSSFYIVELDRYDMGYNDEKTVPITLTGVKNGCLPVHVSLESPLGPSGYFTSADGSVKYWGNDDIEVPYGEDLTLNLVPFDPEHGYVLSVEKSDTSLSDYYYIGCDDTLSVQNVTDTQFYQVSIASCAVPPSDWAREAVGRASALRIFSPHMIPYKYLSGPVSAGADGALPNSSYAAPISRKDFCELARGLYDKGSPKGAADLPSIYNGNDDLRPTFTDTDDDSVRDLAYLGVITGVSEGVFDPDGQLTREQAATILSRLAKVLELDLAGAQPAFDDSAAISSWARDAVGEMQAAGIMGGVGNDLFDPQGAYSWEQSIATIMRLYDRATDEVIR